MPLPVAVSPLYIRPYIRAAPIAVRACECTRGATSASEREALPMPTAEIGEMCKLVDLFFREFAPRDELAALPAALPRVALVPPIPSQRSPYLPTIFATALRVFASNPCGCAGNTIRSWGLCVRHATLIWSLPQTQISRYAASRATYVLSTSLSWRGALPVDIHMATKYSRE